MWSTLPTCVVPYLSALPLPAATKSCAVLNGLFLPTISTCGSSVARASGTRSSYLYLPLLRRMVSRWVCVMSAMVWPSFGRSHHVVHRRGAAAAGAVHHHELGLEHARCVDHHHARGDVGAAADAGMGDHLDRLRGNLSCARNGNAESAALPPAKPISFLRFEFIMGDFPPRRPV